MERPTASGRRGGAAGGRASGFTLVALVVFIAVLNVLVAAALPLWTQVMRRDKEEELIFRGLQYAEGIRVFQLRFGRYPVRIEELIEVHPRCIRQLWKDPMTPDGEWGLIFAQPAAGQRLPGSGGDDDAEETGEDGRSLGGRVRRQRQPGLDPEQGRGRLGAPGEGRLQATGPILGVHSRSEEKAVKTFMGGGTHKDWQFTVNLLPAAPPVGVEHVPSLNSRWIGRPFPAGLEPAVGAGLEGDQELTEPTEDRRRRGRRGRRRGRGGGRVDG